MSDTGSTIFGAVDPFVETRRKALSKEMDGLTMELVKKKREINALTGVARLCPEILLEIFEQYMLVLPTDEDNRRRGRLGPGRAYEFLRIGQVYHRWREIALNAPRLWCNISLGRLSSAAEVEERVRRAKNVLLDVLCDNVRRIDEDAIRAVLAHSHRIQRLDLVKIPTTLDRFQAVIPTSVPHLRSLLLPTWMDSSITPFDACSFSALQELQAGCYRGMWKSPLLRPTLTHLSLRGSPVKDTLEEILCVLRSMPLLEALELRATLPCASKVQDPAHIIPVELPRLKKLGLHDDPSTSALPQFLAALRLRPPVIMNISLNPDGGVHASTRTVSTLARLLAEGALGGSLLTATIFITSGLKAKFFLTRTSADHADNYRLDAPLTFEVCQIDRGDNLRALGTMMKTFPLSDLQALSLTLTEDVIDRMKSSSLRRWFSRMPALRELSIGKYEAHILCGLLSAQPSSTDNTKNPPYLPNLETLQLERVYCWSRKLLDQYRSQLLTRKQQGFELRHLILKHCGDLGDAGRGQLEDVVVEVTERQSPSR